MIDTIYNVRPQATLQANGINHGSEKDTKETGSSSRKDIYTPGNSIYKSECVKKPLPPDLVASLAEKYDVKNMTRNEYGSLLQELRDSGVISSKDFGVGYGGEGPYVEPDGVQMTMGATDGTGLEPWPSGNEKADFTKLLRACARYCTDFASQQEGESDGRNVGNSLADSYQRLLEVFDQIDRAAQRRH